MCDAEITVREGPWRFEWHGGRLMDVYHQSKPTKALECVQVGPFDFSTYTHLAPVTEESIRARAQEWIADYADDFLTNALPYA
jgi:hypothetical protein